ncbi:zinc finger protein 695 isoform X3 [Amyelois transitella]|uniref:zinc finger protein 695 isoform X3 n=1 Tax=Amyelois transitella TaxID=680683 RepID=UPI00298F4963|nr:zinc finger protein 695 isoform X3 [Amyelois transitella]
MLYSNNSRLKRRKTSIISNATKEKDIFQCRVCNCKKANIPIFNNSMHPDIPEEINNFTGVVISNSDSFSKHICENCLDLLNGCIRFRNICQKTNKTLLELSIKQEIECNNEETYQEDSNVVETDETYYFAPYSAKHAEENSQIWNCSNCNADFSELISYNNHLPKCSKKVEGKRRRTRGPNKLPRGTKIYKKKFLCDICGKIASSNAQLYQHRTIHRNVFPYKCDVCPYQGRTLDLLKVHKRSHMVDKPFKCTQCPKSTTTSSNLAKHMRHVHSTNRPYKCSYCDKGFTYQHAMNKHVSDIHLRQNTAECDVCFKTFNTRKILQGHRIKVHKIKSDRHGRLPSYLQCQLESAEKDTDSYENENDDSMPTLT